MACALEINIPGSPDIGGLRFRLLDPAADFPRASELYNHMMPLYYPQFVPLSPEALAQQFGPLQDEERQNLLVAEVNGEMIGWGYCEGYRQRKDLYVGEHTFLLLPEWQRRGIGRAALRYFEARVSALVQKHPGGQAIYKIFVHEADSARLALLRSAGYTRMAAHAIMLRPDLEHIPDHSLPAGIVIRPVSAEQVRAIYEAHREAFREHIHGFDPSDEDFAQWSQLGFLSDRSLWIIAWDEAKDEIAGEILNYILPEENAFYGRQRGYVEWISVRRLYRRRGLARAMIVASLRLLKERGMKEAGLSSHTENPFNPISLYTEMGFQTRFQVIVMSKPV